MFSKKKELLVSIANNFSSINEAAETVAKSNRELAKVLEEASKADVKARDRVDISLEEYLRLREREKDLSEAKEYYEKLLSKLGIPLESFRYIDLESVRAERCIDPIRCGVSYKIMFRVYDDMLRLNHNEI